MSRRSLVMASLSIVLACAVLFGADGRLMTTPVQTALAAPMAAPDNSIALQSFKTGFSFPVFMTHAGDGSDRLYVVEKAGLIKLIVDGTLRDTPFLDLVDEVVDNGEQGLLGLAFHPQYETNRRFFVYYTKANPSSGVGNNVLAEYHRNASNPEIADEVEVHTFLSIPDFATNHNGGTIAFGQDGKLYLATGDGGANANTAQDLNSLFGKVLRLDVDAEQTPETTPDPPGADYAIPTDNPYFGQANVREEIWASGLRNPYRWSFDRQTGDMFIADVGAGTWEEVSLLRKGVAGLNLGWVIREGKHCTPPASSCNTNGLTDPILEYDRATNNNPTPTCAAITGGYRYRGTQNPALQGIYFYADFCSGKIWKGVASGQFWGAIEALDTNLGISGFGEDESGELYVVTSGGEIFRLVQAASSPPANCSDRPKITVQTQRTGSGQLTVTLTANNSSTVSNNRLESLAFNRIVNSTVTHGSQVNQQSPFTVNLSAGPTTTNFTVQRQQAGNPIHVDFTVTDRCGPWQTFVGAGTGLQ